MAEVTLPYLTAHGNITRGLEKIKSASTPDRFTHDFLETKLGLTGGGARPLVSFLKRTGFLRTDGTPTPLYQRFRGNARERGAAAAEAVRQGYRPLYEINEYAHDLSDDDLRGIIVQATGHAQDSRVVRAIVPSFRALAAFADFDAKPTAAATTAEPSEAPTPMPLPRRTDAAAASPFRLGYTINLNLPATSDIAVFNAIFKSLREHLIPPEA
jgi:hypothetical protein